MYKYKNYTCKYLYKCILCYNCNENNMFMIIKLFDHSQGICYHDKLLPPLNFSPSFRLLYVPWGVLLQLLYFTHLFCLPYFAFGIGYKYKYICNVDL